MVHTCNPCNSSLLFDSNLSILYNSILFPDVSCPPQSIEQISQPCGLIHHLLQALHHIVDCNSDTHIVLQNDMCHLPWEMCHTGSPILVTWYSIDMPQGEFTSVLEILELPQTHHSFSFFRGGAPVVIGKSLIWMRHSFKHHQTELCLLFGRFSNLFLFLLNMDFHGSELLFSRMEESFTCHSPEIPKIHVVYGWNKMARIK